MVGRADDLEVVAAPFARQDVSVVTLTEFLADKRLLLVLDNFEQITTSSRLVSEIVAHAPPPRGDVDSRPYRAGRGT
jgi:hypothetical protein